MAGAPEERAPKVNGEEHEPGPPGRQGGRLPFLEQFSARGVFGQNSRFPTHYELSFGLRVGVGVGKTLGIEIPRFVEGAPLAASLRALAAAIDQCVKDCQAPRGIAAPTVARMPAPGEACALCASTDPARFSTCRRPGCPVAAARGAAPIHAPGVLDAAISAAYATGSKPDETPEK